MNFNSWIIICIVLSTIALIAVAVYLIIALLQIRRTAKEMEESLKRVNTELDMLNKVSGKVLSMTEKISSPLMSAFSVLFYIFSGNKSKRKNADREE